MGESIAEFFDSLPGDKPFCLSVSFNVPHGSQTTSMYPDYPDWRLMTRPANENPKLRGSPFYDRLYRDLDIRIPPETATDPYRFIPKFIMDQDKGRRTQTYPYDYTRPTCLEHHIRYYQTITGLDHVIGGMLAELERLALAKNTVIIFASDHGLLMGEYGMGGKAHAGVQAPEFMSGRSLRPLVEGKTEKWRDELFLENLYTGRDTPFQEGIRRGKWKYIRMYDGKVNYEEADVDFSSRNPDFEMLFDLESDPGEMNNLIESHAESEVLASLRRRCAAHSRALNQRRQALRKTVQTERR
ncbi:MAG: hypothetical protein AMJ65_08100 [Phycisphaerae bacterium SG8_4]|nr:MAG: hypothetical protein AMJ65_08100 [Phycisphaerae bacterium SG8_4]